MHKTENRGSKILFVPIANGTRFNDNDDFAYTWKLRYVKVLTPAFLWSGLDC